MIAEHPHTRLARAAWSAASIGDADSLAALCSEELVWSTAGRGKRSGVHRGRAAVFGYLAEVADLAERFDSTLEDILVGASRVVMLFRVRAERGDKRLDAEYVLIFRVAADRIAEVWLVPRDQYAVDEFWD